MKYAAILVLYAIMLNSFLKKDCYCLNVADSRSAMIDNCILFKSNGEFVYRFDSDLLWIEEFGKWERIKDTIWFSTFTQEEDYIKIERVKAAVSQDSVLVQFDSEEIDDKSFLYLHKYQGDSLFRIPFNEAGFAKIRLDTISEYGTDGFLTPIGYSFKLEADDKLVKMKIKLMDKIHASFFKNERMVIEGEKAYWIDRYEDDTTSYWEKVSFKKYKRRYKK